MKEKRKNRLDKGTSSEFIGFNAFGTATAAAASTFGTTSTPAATGSDRSGISWTPVYSGSDPSVQKAFSWLTSKRDPTTHVKALQTLTDQVSQTDIPKKIQIMAVQHFVWLYHRKIYFDSMSSVRAAALQLWVRIRERLPKAFANLVETNAAATSSTDATVVLGMLYSTLVDSSSEVQQVVNDPQTKQILFEGLYATNNDEASSSTTVDVDWEGGILHFADYILSCGRHSVFYERLLQGKKTTQTSSYADLGDDQKDAVLETYLRVMAIALDSLVLYMRHHPTGKLQSSSSLVDTTVWYKTISSSHANLRQRTYALVAAVASRCAGGGNDVLFQHIPNLTQSLSSEKEPSNWPALLECLLTWTQASNAKLPAHYVQPIIKAWKKSLYGANMAMVGPMLLPLTALMATPSEVWKLLHAAYEGRDLTLGGTDRWRLIQAITESLSFGLLRKQTDTAVLAEYNAEWTQLYGKILVEVLATDPDCLTGTSRVAHDEVLQNTAKQLPRLEAFLAQPTTVDENNPPASNALEMLARQTSREAVAASILPLINTETNDVVSISSKAVSKFVDYSDNLLLDDSSPFIPIFRSVFESRCPRKASGDVPSDADYEALQIVMKRVSCRRLFGKETGSTVEKFVMNDLLRWSVIHTSTLATGQLQGEEFVEHDFQLLRQCLDSLDGTESRLKLWEPFLREILSAKCHVQWLAAGLKTLLKTGSAEDSSWINCKALDDFVRNIDDKLVAVADDAASEASFEETDEERHVMEFLAMCCGISAESQRRLVDINVIKSLADQVCKGEYAYGSRPSPVERTLLNIVEAGRSEMLNQAEQNTLLLHAWLQGSHLLMESLLACLNAKPELRRTFIADASLRCKQELNGFRSRVDLTQRDVKIWAIRASDLIQLCPLDVDDCGCSRSFTLVGLSNLHWWSSHPTILFDCSMELLSHVGDTAERYSLLTNSSEHSTTALLLSILLSLSSASTDLVQGSLASQSRDRCSRFLRTIGGSSLDKGFVELCLRDEVKALTDLCNSDGASAKLICRHVHVISELLGALVRPVTSGCANLSAENVKTGDQIWYIPDPSLPNVRVPACVVKAHFDAQAGYFFSISITKDGNPQERQTVIERLRGDSSDLPDEDVSTRKVLRELLVPLVLRFFEKMSWLSCIPELVNVLVRQVGVGDERGLGSCHYDVFQLLKKETDTLVASLVERNTRCFENSAWKLSMAFGFGVSVPPCTWIASVFKIDYKEVLGKVAADFHVLNGNASLVNAALSLFSGLLPGAITVGEGDKLDADLFSFVCSLTEAKMESSTLQSFTSDYMLALRTFVEAASFASDSEDILRIAQRSMAALVRDFSSSWDVPTDSGDFPPWNNLVERLTKICMSNSSLLTALRDAATASAEDLVSCLFCTSKRHIAIDFIIIALGRSVPIRDEGSISLPQSTERLAEEWKTGLTPEEAEELMQDVEVVSQWLPHKIMSEIEKWKDEDFESINDRESTGRFLTWLVVLHVIDNVAPMDFRNRPAFVSYLRCAQSCSSILNRAILYEPYVNEPKGSKSVPEYSQSLSYLAASDAQIGNLASLVLLRTTEVLPSLCRRWWEDACPKVYTGPVQTLVEKYIAPVILDRELKRVRNSPDTFGDMNVTGSAATRQISAQYVQDDFTLKVLIQLPETFPLRSAHVDCSKTLGVPQTRWKRWSLQITQMLNNQGGTLQDALVLWKDNVDKEFEGVEPCPVCYSVLHVKTHKLPALECNTCHNRFHADCLNQWFRSSGKSQCVLCQQDWRGSRVL